MGYMVRNQAQFFILAHDKNIPEFIHRFVSNGSMSLFSFPHINEAVMRIL